MSSVTASINESNVDITPTPTWVQNYYLFILTPTWPTNGGNPNLNLNPDVGPSYSTHIEEYSQYGKMWDPIMRHYSAHISKRILKYPLTFLLSPQNVTDTT